MWSAVFTLITRYWKPLLTYVAPILLVLGIVWYIYDKGYTNCETKAEVKEIKTVIEVKDAQQKAAAAAPRTRADVINRLRSGTF